MKTIILLASVALVFSLASCKQDVITFNSTPLDVSKYAEVRLVYDLPRVPTTANSIKRLKYNDQLVSMITTPLGSIFPNSVAKYHAVPQGNVKIDAFRVAAKDSAQIYSSSFTLGQGKFTAFLYDTLQPPFVIQDEAVLPYGDPWADTTANIKFVNLLYKADGVTPYGTLFLKGRRGAGTTASPYVYIDIASCGFKQASALIPYKLKPSISGTESSMVFVLFDGAGNLLQYYPSTTGALTNYAATGFSLVKGRNWIFHVNGKLGTNYATQAIRLSTIALN